jgi:hypothetical protein
MNRCMVLVLAGLCAHSLETQGTAASSRHRLIILADMGNEPDEEQQMAHMLVCSNEFDLDGLIAVTGKFLRARPRPELLLKLIGGYEKVLPNLKLHAQGWPTAEYLHGPSGWSSTPTPILWRRLSGTTAPRIPPPRSSGSSPSCASSRTARKTTPGPESAASYPESTGFAATTKPTPSAVPAGGTATRPSISARTRGTPIRRQQPASTNG